MLTSGTPDAVDVELWMLGEVEPPELESVVADAAAGPLAAELAELEATEDWWQRNRRPLPVDGVLPLTAPDTLDGTLGTAAAPPLGELVPFPAPPPPTPVTDYRSLPVSGQRTPARRGLWLAAAAALAAATLLAVRVTAPTDTVDAPVLDDGGVRTMGTLPVELFALRDGHAEPAPAQPRAGDELQVGLLAPGDGWVTIGTVQDDGQVFVLWQGEVTAGQPLRLDAAVRLDDHAGQEWLVVRLDEAPADAERLRTSAKRGSDARTWVREVTRAR